MEKLVDLFRIEQEIEKAKHANNLNHALKLYNQVILIKQQISNKLGLAKTYAEMAFLLEQKGSYQEAYYLLSKAANISENSPNRQFNSIISSRIHSLSHHL
ncbi:MAG: hypothetical protein ACTSVU_09455 [Promethearchaeota archaeon]